MHKIASDFGCFRCETKGKTRKAEVFVEIDGLHNNDKYPLCISCKKEWEEEYEALVSGNLNSDLNDY